MPHIRTFAALFICRFLRFDVVTHKMLLLLLFLWLIWFAFCWFFVQLFCCFFIGFLLARSFWHLLTSHRHRKCYKKNGKKVNISLVCSTDQRRLQRCCRCAPAVSVAAARIQSKILRLLMWRMTAISATQSVGQIIRGVRVCIYMYMCVCYACVESGFVYASVLLLTVFTWFSFSASVSLFKLFLYLFFFFGFNFNFILFASAFSTLALLVVGCK